MKRKPNSKFYCLKQDLSDLFINKKIKLTHINTRKRKKDSDEDKLGKKPKQKYVAEYPNYTKEYLFYTC